MSTVTTRVAAGASDALRKRRSLRIDGLDLVGHLALVAVILFAMLAIFGPTLAPHDPNQINLSRSYWGSDSSHWLGYDAQGRDIVSRLLVGARLSFLGPLTIVILAGAAGLTAAVFAAWRGGWMDAAVAGVLDASMAFPGILVAVMTVAIFGAGLPAVVLALAIAYSPYIARVARSAALAEMGKDYVDAQRIQGFSGLSICARHVVPNILPIAMGQAALTLAWATVDLAGLSFLGFGIQPPDADWGIMVASGQAGVLSGYPTESLAAGVCLVAAVCSFTLLGERLLRRAEVLAS